MSHQIIYVTVSETLSMVYMRLYLRGTSQISSSFRRQKLQGVSRLESKVKHPVFWTYVGAAGYPFTWWTGIVADLIFWKKIWNFLFCLGQGQVQAQAGFQAQPCFQQVQVHVIHGYSLFGLKTTTHGKSDIKCEFLRPDLPCEVVFRTKSWIPADNMSLNLLKTGLSLKTSLSLYLALTLTKWKISKIFFKKSNPPQCPFTT